MSIQDYLHEKAEESRHNEIIAYMMFLAGSVFFVGGILSSLGMGREPSWFLFIPYLADYTQVLFLEIALLLTGLLLIFSGIGVGVHYYRDRGWYMKELGKANNAENLMREQRIQIGSPILAPRTRSVSTRRKKSN
jgi:uncharacterized membrane protein